MVATAAPAKCRPTSRKFTQRPNWLFRTKFGPAVREVYTVLLSHAWNGKTEVHPSVATIAKEAGLGTTAARSALRVLELSGVISVRAQWNDAQHTEQTSNLYTVRPLTADQIKAVCALSKSDIRAMAEALTPTHQTTPPTEIPGSESEPPRFGIRSTPGPDSVDEVDEVLKRRIKTDELGWDGTSACGGTSEAAPRVTQVDGQEVSKDLGYNEPLADPEKERQAQALVDLFASLRRSLGDSPLTDTQRKTSAKSARLILAHDQSPATDVDRVLRWACADIYWSTRIETLFQLRKAYPKLLTESQSRRPHRLAQRRVPHGDRVMTEAEQRAKEQRRQEVRSRFATSLTPGTADSPPPAEGSLQARLNRHQ